MILGFKTRFRESILDGRKKHTIREDKKNRHGIGKMLHLSVNVRTKHYACLKQAVCTGTQTIAIEYGNGGYCDVFVYQDVRVVIDGRELCFTEICQLAKNDGFENQDDFFRWFKNDFFGKIIHWTDLKY